jgi:thioredoxin reductase
MPIATDSHITTTASNTSLYDVIIIGGSHAGLSAALTLYRALHTCLIFDSRAPRNALASSTHLTSAWENKDPEKLREVSKAELLASGLVQFIPRKITMAEKTSKGIFEVKDEEGVKWRGRKILLSIGVQEIYPSIEGYTENYGFRM